MRALVTYASHHGSTAEVGERIAATLIKDGVDAEALRVQEVPDIAGYDAVVMGSAVYYGRWMNEAVTFVDRNRTQLARRAIWLFSVGPLGDQPRTEPAVIGGLIASLGAVEHHLFSGALDLHKLSFPERVIAKGVKTPTGDFRDWNEIDSWALTIARTLKALGLPSLLRL